MVPLPRLSIDEESKYVAPKIPKHVVSKKRTVVDNVDITEEDSSYDDHLDDDDKDAGDSQSEISVDSFGKVDGAASEEKVVCECEYCHKMISWENLTDHE